MQAQLRGTADVTDFLAYYGGARIFVERPRELYDAAANAAIQHELQGGRDRFVPFVSPPHVALIQAPLAWLPFGWAYVTWTLINLVCLGLSAYLLAGRHWLVWLVAAPLFVPVLFGLIMGQTSFVMLLGFSIFARAALDGRASRGAIALAAWTWKPNLVPALVVALVVGRRWRACLALAGTTAALVAAAVLRLGWSGLLEYLQVATQRWSVASERPDGYPEGATLLVAAQDVLGVGAIATVLAVAAAVLVYALVALLWRTGLHAGSARYLQLAVLPVASTIASPHAGIYELTLWLASAWLLLSFAREQPTARTIVLGLVLGIWATGNLAVVGERSWLIVTPALVGALTVGWATMRGWRLQAR